MRLLNNTLTLVKTTAKINITDDCNLPEMEEKTRLEYIIETKQIKRITPEYWIHNPTLRGLLTVNAYHELHNEVNLEPISEFYTNSFS